MMYQVGKTSTMAQHIILAHLQSMQKQLDFLVHKHLSPLEIRQHHIAQALEQLEIETPSTNQDSTDYLDDEHTNRYEDSYQIQMLPFLFLALLTP